MSELAEDPLVPIDRAALEKLVKVKTPFTMAQFENLMAWSFVGDAPASRRKLAWETINLGPEALKQIKRAQECFPRAHITKIST